MTTRACPTGCTLRRTCDSPPGMRTEFRRDTDEPNDSCTQRHVPGRRGPIPVHELTWHFPALSLELRAGRRCRAESEAGAAGFLAGTARAPFFSSQRKWALGLPSEPLAMAGACLSGRKKRLASCKDQLSWITFMATKGM